jgi:RNA polymerase sigma-70 factor, ECF subfamily
MGCEDDEPELIRAAVGGDRVAFSRLCDRHAAAVARRLSHLSGPSGAVDDLLQETLLRAMRAVTGFRGECAFRTWLLGIATSVARDEQRRARRSIWRLFLEPEELDEAPACAGRGAEAYADLAAVHRALDRLSPRLREVVILFELEGASLAEIAAELGVSIHTVGSRLRRGRERLRELLERSGYGDLAAPAPLLCLKERT